MILHTSGSTGIPKPVVVNHGTLSAVDAYQIIPSLGGEATIGPSLRGKRILLGFPLFHAAGVQFTFGYGVYYGAIIAYPPTHGPLTAETVDRSLSLSYPHVAALPPSLVVDLFNNADCHDRIRSLDSLIYAGGPLPEAIGNQISQLTRLTMLVGATEYPLAPLEPVQAKDWQYVKFSRYAGIHIRPQDALDVFEQVFVKYDGLDLFQGIFATFPDLDEYSMGDLYQLHPTEPGLCRFYGRKDDLIIFTTAEKLNPIDMESVICSHPAISAALVGGHGRSQCFLLIEPEKVLRSSEEEVAFVDDIWATVDRANDLAPSYGRVMKDFILLTSEAKPPIRAGKGTVQRKPTMQLYEQEIDDLYQAPELPRSKYLVEHEPVNEESLTDALVRLVKTGARLSIKPLPAANLLDLGLDSWKVVAICKYINAYLLHSRPDLHILALHTVYEHPSIEGIEMALNREPCESGNSQRFQQMQTIFDECALILPHTRKESQSYKSQSTAVLMTGSSGSLGSYVLKEMILRHPTATIYCLNRTHDAVEHHINSYMDKGIAPDFPGVTFLVGDANAPLLGLTAPMFETLTREVNSIIHIAWKIDFNQSLDQYARTDLRGMCNLLDLATKCDYHVQFNFVSSTSAVIRSPTGLAPEQVNYDWNAADSMGYAESNLIAERLVAMSAERKLIRANIARVGQVAGPTTEKGVWSKHEWFPTLVACSSLLGKLPDTLGTYSAVDWIPVDIVARVILEILAPKLDDHLPVLGTHSESTNGSSPPADPSSTRVFNVVNPSKTSWTNLAPTILETIASIDVMLPYADWLRLLRRAASQTENSKGTPLGRAVTLLPFFEKLGRDQPSTATTAIDTTVARETSPTLGALQAVSGDWLRVWIEQWGLSG